MTNTNHDRSTGELPGSWESCTLGEVADFVRGVTYKKAQSESEAGLGLLPIVRATNLVDGVLTDDELVYVPESLVKPEQVLQTGDIVIATSSGSESVVGKSAQFEEGPRTSFGAFCGLVRPHGDNDRRFVQRYLESPSVRSRWSEAARGTNINNLKRAQIAETPIPIPPVSEQERIVEVLEAHLSRLDGALEHVQTLREKADQFRRSLLHAAFTGALTGHDTSTGELPDGWTHTPLGELASVSGGKRLPKGTPWSATPNGHPYIRAIDVQEGEINPADLVYVPTEVWPAISRYVVDAGDVVITIAGTIGKVGRVPASLVGANLTENAARIGSIASRLDGGFLTSYLRSPGALLQMAQLSTSTTQAKLALFRIKTILIPVPPLSEQHHIVEVLEAQLSRLDAALAVADEVEERASALRRSLLHAAFTGKLTEKWREENCV